MSLVSKEIFEKCADEFVLIDTSVKKLNNIMSQAIMENPESENDIKSIKEKLSKFGDMLIEISEEIGS